jgi:hypothetical protein
MKKIILTLAACAVAFAPAAAAPRLHGEAELARLLEGRTAGAPVDCIDLNRVHSSQIIDRTAIVYDAGNTLYVNRPRAGAESLDRFDAMLEKPWNHQLCRVDVVRLLDTGARFEKGSVFLDDFVPYTRVKGAGRR